jgi:hypothetical protein
MTQNNLNAVFQKENSMQKKILFLVLTVALFGIPAYAQTKQPKTVRDFFNLLPRKYFEIGCCGVHNEPDLEKAHAKYLETFLRVEDTANGYLEGGCEGGQSCISMALFKRPDGTYIVGVETTNTMYEHNYFLEYRNGRWYDISAKVIPQFSKNKLYSLPRYGTKIEVFAKKIIERVSDDQVINEMGPKIYDLVWINGKFILMPEV